MDTAGLDVNRIKQNVSEYWRAEAWNWPVKVMSAQRVSALGASAGRYGGEGLRDVGEVRTRQVS
jgi:hypothetical protein